MRPPSPSRRRFLAALGATPLLATIPGRTDTPPSAAASPSRRSGFVLEELTLADLQQGLRSGRWTARRLAEMYLERIDRLDRRGPALRSVIETNPEAIAIARELDAERKAGHLRGPLHGIPILLKDNIDTADRTHTSAGSLALADSIPSKDAFVARKLRDAGAILLGKANLSEWANFRSNRSSSGWSARGGQCRNPYLLDRNPSGSSSGTAAAITANLAAAGIGTETDGSIVSPSSHCGLVGLKPTVGLLSRSGIIPISASQDTSGPMTRTVADAAILLGAMTGTDPRDPATSNSSQRAAPDYTAFLDRDGLRGARIGVARRLFGSDARVTRLLEGALSAMREAGAECIDLEQLAESPELSPAEMTVLQFEFKAGLNDYLAQLGPATPVQSLKELIAFNERNARSELGWFGQEILLESESKGPLTDKAYTDARETCLRLAQKEGLSAAFESHRLDTIVAPSNGPAWVTDLVNGDHYTLGSSTLPATAGSPNLTIPVGDIQGLPIGISFFGRPWTEGTLIRIGYAFEQRTRARKAPTFRATLAD